MAKKWIAKAIKKPGSFTKSAKAAGESTHEFAEEHKHDSGKTGARARLAMTLGAMHHSKHATSTSRLYGRKKD